jgi:predicted TIM-barrel fold metal-dependent hydrolase
MVRLNRRTMLAVGAGVAVSGSAAPLQFGEQQRPGPVQGRLPLVEFEPKSMLVVRETKVEKPKFPVIDFHTHLSWSPGFSDPAQGGGKFRPAGTVEEILPVMERRGIRMLVNQTGGHGSCLDQALAFFKGYPDRFLVFTEPSWQQVTEPGYAKSQADELAKAHNKGARGLKVLKTLGLYLRQDITKGALIKVDDKRFDPMWEAAGALKMPVLIHVSDPAAFFLPIDRYNERYEELHAHPDWSFHGDFPSNRELHEARNRVIARHPNTQFVLAHVGNSEDLGWVGEWLDRHPNMNVEIGARIGELGRQPRTSRRFFEKYQDRVLFGTDAVPHGDEYPQQVYGDLLYQIYYRFLETEDEYFDYAPAAIPPQGRWRIYGLGLPDPILRKVYRDNAARLLGISS